MKSIRTKLNQRGIASIIVAGVFVVIISLIVTSFALLMRREQRQSLDKQLSTQAYYAAESGVNAAVKALDEDASISNEDCNATNEILPGSNDLGDSLEYTCVLVDNDPGELIYSPVSTEKSTILKLNAPGATEINISWQASGNSSNENYVAEAEDHPLPTSTSSGALKDSVWGSGVLRVSLMPILPTISREQLIRDTQTLFLYPNLNSTAGRVGEHTYSDTPAGKGVFVDSECNPASGGSNPKTPYDCNMKITNLPNTDTYYIRLKSIYSTHAVQITANSGNGNQIQLPGTQAVIDATGKANDVLRRIQVRVPLNASYSYPEFGLETTNAICKDLELYVPIPGHSNNSDKDNCS